MGSRGRSRTEQVVSSRGDCGGHKGHSRTEKGPLGSSPSPLNRSILHLWGPGTPNPCPKWSSGDGLIMPVPHLLKLGLGT